MTKLIVLDTAVLGIATNPNGRVNAPVVRWINQLIRNGHRVYVPEVADYELRRELVRRGARNAIARLNLLGRTVGYLALDTNTMRAAADYWAQSRAMGKPLAHDHALDGDVILCAQARLLGGSKPNLDVIVATNNVSHLRQFVAADEWQRI